tara:strand:- start:15503 stop:17539 length:2037 start_codon:yes stop_codon:yes gene_type:complete
MKIISFGKIFFLHAKILRIMNVKVLSFFCFFIAITPYFLQAQESQIRLLNQSLELRVNERVQLEAEVLNAEGVLLADTVVFFSRARRSLVVSREGELLAIKPGVHIISAMTLGADRIRQDFEVNVLFPPITYVKWEQAEYTFYSGTSLDLMFEIRDSLDVVRSIDELFISSSDESIFSVNDFNQLSLNDVGSAKLIVVAGTEQFSWPVKVLENKATALTMKVTNPSSEPIKTGDVVHFSTHAEDRKRNTLANMPVQYSFVAYPNDQSGQGNSAQIAQDGRFVASHAGKYSIIASSGAIQTTLNITVQPRNIRRSLEVVGKGIVPDVKTSDLWVWEGIDGRDYAITGTWGARGEAFLWDVTDPSNIHTIDTVQVDARTVNDVKVSEDGTIAVITREGASNRKNGIIILDVTNPSETTILSEYTDGLTGGVHNTFIYENHVYAVNNGRKYDIINIEDPRNPYTVGVFELDTPGHSIHDVWIEDGIAYSSNWGDGVVAVDVGLNNSSDMTGAGGSPANPIPLGSYTYPSGWNHAAFPFKSESTGKFYVAAGDEAFPYGLDTQGPNRAAGWVHFIEFDGWDNPDEVARYQVPEAGSHNYWIENDVMYAAFYNGGLRVVDVSGDLMGDLYEQGREIALFLPSDPNAAIPNSTFTWGPQPYKGLIFLSDWNSGIWAVKLGEVQN